MSKVCQDYVLSKVTVPMSDHIPNVESRHFTKKCLASRAAKLFLKKAHLNKRKGSKILHGGT